MGWEDYTDDQLMDEVAAAVDQHEEALWDLINIVTNHMPRRDSLNEDQQEWHDRATRIVAKYHDGDPKAEADGELWCEVCDEFGDHKTTLHPKEQA